jgi:hypothetical protein
MGAACGIELVPLAPTDGLPGRGYDAVLCDWDFWPVELRQELLADLSNGPLPCTVAVHGYNLDEHATMQLRDQGVVVQCRLQLDLFRRLRLAHRRACSAAVIVSDSEVA